MFNRLITLNERLTITILTIKLRVVLFVHLHVLFSETLIFQSLSDNLLEL